MKKMKKQIVKPKNVFFCSNCGSQLLEYIVGAERIIKCFLGSCWHPEDKYNDRTGKRQYALRYRCPNAKWWNDCDEFIDKKIITIN